MIKMTLKSALKDRILVLDGAMGTMVQQYLLSEKDFRGERFVNHSTNVKGNNDLLCLTKPSIIETIHCQYLAAGADIISTDTLNAQRISQADYALEDYVYEMNLEAAKIARKAADLFTKNTNKPRFVAGSVGPTSKTASMSPDVNNPAFRSVSFDDLVADYTEQMTALIEGGVDALLIETIFDTLNAKAAIFAAEEAMKKLGKKVEIMLSVTVADKGGRTLSGQTIAAFHASVAHAQPLSIGLNCSFGAKDIYPFLKEFAGISPFYVSVYPNAGLPNQYGEYDETPETMGAQIKNFIDNNLLNIVGGCCGSTPQHIEVIANLAKDAKPRKPKEATNFSLISGLEVLELKTSASGGAFTNIGERCNVAGSRKFLRLINEKKYEEALSIALKQVEDGANLLDINMDDAMLDAKSEMTTFLNYIASDPEISRVPLMIDSSKWEVIEAGLKCVQGKCIVNSISLKDGEEKFLQKAEKLRKYGAAAVVMAFDEQGQADSFARKIEICQRAYSLLTEKINFPPQDIIFDPNVLAIATGIEEHNNYAVDFLKTIRWIKQNLPFAKVSGGLSNLSFSFRGNNTVREAMHSAFLYHAIGEGMDMAIVNAGALPVYDEIPKNLLERVEDVIFNKRADAAERLIHFAETIKNTDTEVKEQKADAWRNEILEKRLKHSIIKGIPDFLETDLQEALEKYKSPVEIIEQPLMNGMKTVGELFGDGKMFLPQVVKAARNMKKAVAILQPYIEKEKQKDKRASAGKFLIATVKGDVHDIGKNIVGVIMACNNFEVIDLGVMVSAETIVQTAIEQQVDIVGLSGLITPSLEEMCNVAAEMQRAGLTIPLLIGGATTSKIHTAVKIAPNYAAPVIYVKDASVNAFVATQLLSSASHEEFIEQINAEYSQIRETQSTKQEEKLLTLAEARKLKIKN